MAVAVKATTGAEEIVMSFVDLPPDERDALYADLQRLYDDFDEQTAHLPAPRGSCAGCGRCCTGPPLYMTCSDLEFHYSLTGARGTPAARFEEASPDHRHAYAHWTCPFYSQAEGCTVYERRPFACRVYGRYARVPVEWDFCVYQQVAVPYDAPDALPQWAEYSALLRRYPAHRGYPWPTAFPYTRPAVELLLGTMLPWAPMNSVRIAL